MKLTLTYFPLSSQLPADTFLVVCQGVHEHVGGPNTGKIWSPRANRAARDYVAAREAPSLLGLHHHSQTLPDETVPDTSVVSNWFRRAQREMKAAKTTAPEHVATIQRSIEKWAVRSSNGESSSLYVLSPFVLSGAEVCVTFTCVGMAEGTIGRYTFDSEHLAVDGKYKVNDRGWTIFTVSPFCMDFPRNTHLVHGRKLRTQGRLQQRALSPCCKQSCMQKRSRMCPVSSARPESFGLRRSRLGQRCKT